MTIFLWSCLYHGHFIFVLPMLIIFQYYYLLRIIFPINPRDFFFFLDCSGLNVGEGLLFFGPPTGLWTTAANSHSLHTQCLLPSKFQYQKLHLVWDSLRSVSTLRYTNIKTKMINNLNLAMQIATCLRTEGISLECTLNSKCFLDAAYPSFVGMRELV